MTRRTVLKAAALGAAWGAGTLVGAGAAHATPRHVRRTRHQVSWPRRGPARVVHVTDLHLGWGTPDELIDQAATLCRQAEPDLVVLTGDYVNRTCAHVPALRDFVSRLPRPCVATLGNHDHWAGVDAVVEALEAEGVEVLSNRSVVRHLQGEAVEVVGLDDGVTGRDDVAAAFSQVSDPEQALVLTHDPASADAVARAGGRIILAGHTHGGQIRVPGLTRGLLRIAGQRYVAGWYRVGASRLYVNAGVGSAVVRLRVGRRAEPEVAVVELLPAGRAS